MVLTPLITGIAASHHVLQLRRNQWKPPGELHEIQWKRLKNIIYYAYSYIPFYRKHFKSADFKPGDLRTLDDLRRIPVTTKNDVRRHYSDLFAHGTDVSKCASISTSGSTGIPMKIFFDIKTCFYSTAMVAYCSKECGLGIRDKLVKIGGLFPHRYFTPNQICIPLPVESGEMDTITHRLRQIRPDAIYTHPWVLNNLCKFDLHGIELKLAFSHGAKLTEHTRNLVRSRFGLEANDTYGTAEFSRLAFECNEHTGLHILTDNSVIEFLDEGEHVSPGETGEVVVTGLINHAMPLIRYEIDDLGVPSDEACSCGRSWPMIKQIEGRIIDVFTLESGRKIYPSILYFLFINELIQNIFCISEFQIVQEKRNRILLKLVKGKKFENNIIKTIRNNLNNYFLGLAEDVSVEVEFVERIPMDHSGKKKFFVSMKDN